MNSAFRDDCEVAVVGAGPYGLSLGAHLNSAGIETRAAMLKTATPKL